MTYPSAGLEVSGSEGRWRLAIAGDWSLASLGAIDKTLSGLPEPMTGSVECDWSKAGNVDLGAAWVLIERLKRRGGADLRLRHGGNPPPFLQMLDGLTAQRAAQTEHVGEESLPLRRSLSNVGRWATVRGAEIRRSVDFVGRIAAVLMSVFSSIKSLRISSVVRHIYETGITAIPIVALIAFLISVIVAYLGAQQMSRFGAEIFVVDLVTLAVLRELGVLLTAIIVAGRSGSAFAAEIGTMQLNEEVDALLAMGMNPIELLTVPRLLGLVIALPLLTIIADAMGLAGGFLLSFLQLNIPWPQFASRMRESIAPTTFWVGIIKAPVFAALIAIVGTYCGMQVRSSARELGRMTTMAVVQSIFLVIFADALFAVLFVRLDI